MDFLRDKFRQVYTDVVQTLSQGAKPSTPRDADTDELRTIFHQFDIDGDGFIDEAEMKQVLKTMDKNANDQQIHEMFKAADLNGDGRITFEEFIHIANANPLTMSYKQVFKELDCDGDGEISKSELRDGFANMGQHLSDKELDLIFRQADNNKDGKINFDEFVRMMNSKK